MSIAVQLSAIEHLEQLLSSSIPDTPVGGILLGKRRLAPLEVEITEFVALPSAEPRGSYRLAPELLAESRKERRSGAAVAGYFRNRGDAAPGLDEFERNLIQAEFNHPTDIVVIAGRGKASILFWDQGMFTPVPFIEIPLDAALLRREAHVASDSQPPPVPATAERRHRGGSLWLLAFGLIAFAILITASMTRRDAFQFRNAFQFIENLAFHLPAVRQEPSLHLDFEPEPRGYGFFLRWNIQSTGKLPSEGRLIVTPRNAPGETVQLSAGDLRAGHVFYSSNAERLTVRLEVVLSSGETVGESVLAVLRPGESRADAAEPVAASAAEIPAVQPHPAPGISNDRASIPTDHKPARRFFAPIGANLGQNGQNTPVILPDSPGAIPTPALNSPLETRYTITMAEVSPQTKAPPSPTAAPPPTSSVPATRISESPPYPLTKVEPALDHATVLMMGPAASLTVQVRVTIDASGKPVRAEATPRKTAAENALAQAAMKAVMQWRFEPARFGGTPIASEHAINFVFRKP